jgi:hypothetical protein
LEIVPNLPERSCSPSLRGFALDGRPNVKGFYSAGLIGHFLVTRAVKPSHGPPVLSLAVSQRRPPKASILSFPLHDSTAPPIPPQRLQDDDDGESPRNQSIKVYIVAAAAAIPLTGKTLRPRLRLAHREDHTSPLLSRSLGRPISPSVKHKGT